MNIFTAWFHRTFANPQVVLLAGLLIAGFGILALAADVLAPLIASIVIAYLLDGLITMLERRRIPRGMAMGLVFSLFLAILLGIFLILLPLLLSQIAQLIQQLPAILSRTQDLILELPQRYPEIFEDQQILDFLASLRNDLILIGQRILSASVAWLPALVNLVVYLVLMPMLVFFFLKDKERILAWLLSFLPPERRLAEQVWREVDAEIGGYVRGKIYEFLIVAVVTYGAFLMLDLQFSALLAITTGLSTLIPYIGVVLASVPIAVIAYAQWGTGPEFLWVMGAYAVIQLIDGNILAPLLLSEVVNLHPTAVIVALLVFGSIWGFWGIFFAIPLASLVHAVLNAWPRTPHAPQP
ncbi:AI-2E family transporter [Skermanella pratensis]|uniref:AI-2E family transporter n=1 Tax=Skermanella pratensis TaxID=2233999 RepID=UPI0013016526|nr:AI-2E family transporter [Skermanella pratensis]